MFVQPGGVLAGEADYLKSPLMLDTLVRVLACDKELCTVTIFLLQKIPVLPGTLHNCTSF